MMRRHVTRRFLSSNHVHPKTSSTRMPPDPPTIAFSNEVLDGQEEYEFQRSCQVNQGRHRVIADFFLQLSIEQLL
jgi:hypothetical protein